MRFRNWFIISLFRLSILQAACIVLKRVYVTERMLQACGEAPAP